MDPLRNFLEQWQATLSGLLEGYMAQLPDLAAGLQRGISALSTTPDGRIQVSATTELGERLIYAAGWRGFLSTLPAMLNDAAGALQAQHAILGVPVAPSPEAIRHSLSFSLAEFSGVKEGVRDAVVAAIQQGTVTPLRKTTLRNMVQDATASTRSRASTIVETSLGGFQREVALEALKQLPQDQERFVVYMGPESSTTRGFCKRLVDKAIPVRLLRRLKNGHGLPVAKFAGGYNCRHSLIPATQAIVEAQDIEIATSSDVSSANGAARKSR